MFDYDFRFRSLLHPDNYVFTFHNRSWWADQRPNYSMWQHAGFYETMGDGWTQHNTELRVQKEMWTDYLASLAAFLVQPNAAEYARSVRDSSEPAIKYVAERWPDQVQPRFIDFAFGVQYD